MATYFLGQYECRQYFDDNGAPLAGGKVYSYLSGTSTPTFTYADAAGTPNPNPLILDSAGRGSIYLNTELTYKFIITDAADTLIDTVDPISPLPTVTPGNIFTVAPGSPAFPGFTFTGDENTGLYGPGADILAVTTGGTERARWGPTGGMNIGGTTDPGDNNLRVEGTLNVQGATALAGALNVTGLATLSGGVSGSLSVTGATVDTLGVTSLATIATLNVTGNETVGGTLQVNGPATVLGVATVGGLTVSGSETVSGTLQVSGATTVSSTFQVLGQTTLRAVTASAATNPVVAIVSTSGTGGYAVIRGNTSADELYLGSPVAVCGLGAVTDGAIATPAALYLGSQGSAAVRFVTQNTVRATVHPSGGLSLGDATDPGAANLRVAGATTIGSTLTVSGATTLQSTLGVTDTLTVSGATTLQSTLGVTGAATVGGTLAVTGATTLLGNVGIGSPNVTDAVAVPTIASGFGTGPTIGGRAYAFKIVVGSGLPTGGTVNFNQTYAVPPAVVVTSNQLSSGYVVATSSTTQVTIQSTNALQPTTGLYVLVRGV